ncbi:MAG TPA: alpha/beta fold hydrolase [Candidatus Bathyarchaeota archaeon]|nr:alpha/beta fold hydrolase [Candidatus Bathyarchaeota archaeon]
MIEETLTFYSDGLRLEGVLRYPDKTGAPVPLMLLIHGSLEHDRNGNLLRTKDGKQVYPKNFFLEISRRLCKAGFATFSWDKRGYRKSQGPCGSYFSEVNDAQAALDIISLRKDVIDTRKIIIFGQSAGVYVACLLAKKDNRACAYVLSGGLFSEYKEMMSFNYHRVRDYAKSSPENLKWVEQNDLWGLVLGINLDEMFLAIDRGEKEILLAYKEKSWTVPLDNKVYLPEFSCKNQFEYITKPTLIIHGKADLNVPVEDAERIKRELERKGNDIVKLVIIEDADHSFQETAQDEDIRLRERMSLSSFKNRYVESYFENMIDFLKGVTNSNA